jgi:hypothetical protein
VQRFHDAGSPDAPQRGDAGEQMNQPRFAPRIFLLGIGLIALLGSLLIAVSTAEGLTGGSDSVGYLVSARNFTRGIGVGYFFPDGTFHSLTLHPPVYSVGVGLIAFLTREVIQAARVWDILSYGITIFMAGFVFYHFSRRTWLALIVCVLLGLSPAYISIQSSALSESLFMVLYALGIYFLIAYLNEARRRWFVFAVICMAMLPVTRYIGLAMILGSVITIGLFARGNQNVRIIKGILFGALTVIPILVWIAWLYIPNQVHSGSLSALLSPATLNGEFQRFRVATIAEVWAWLPLQFTGIHVTYHTQFLLLGVVVITLLGLTLLAYRQASLGHVHPESEVDFKIAAIYGIFSASYLITFLIAYLANLPPAPTIDDRTYFPLFFSILLAACAAMACWQTVWLRDRPWGQGFACLVAGLFVAGQIPVAFSAVNNARADGGSLAYSWQASPLVNAVRALPRTTPVISNRTDILLYWADRPAYDFISELQPGFVRDANALYGSDPTDRAQVAFREKGAALVIFGNDTPQELENVFFEAGRLRANTIFQGLVRGGRYPDGSIYFYPK